MHKWYLHIHKQQEASLKQQEEIMAQQKEMMKLMKEYIARKNNAFDDDGFSVGL